MNAKVEKENQEKILLSEQLNAALNIIKSKYNNRELIPKLLEVNPALGKRDKTGKIALSETHFNKHKNVYKNPTYLSYITLAKFTHLMKAVNLLLIKEFKKEWNGSTKSYVDIPSIITDAASFGTYDGASSERIEHLFGMWTCLSWNQLRSEINYFTLRIYDEQNVICENQYGTLGGNIFFITKDRIAISLASLHRRIYFIAKVGLGDHLKKIHELNVAYVDSGDEKVKSGIAIFKRVLNEEEWKKTRLTSRPTEEFAESIVSRLKNTQLIAEYLE